MDTVTSTPTNQSTWTATGSAAPTSHQPPDQAPTYVAEARDVFKIYRMRGVETVALRGVDLQIRPGEMVALLGPSGSGKSTLLHLLGGLDTPSAGQVYLGRQELAVLTERERAVLRRRTLGFVFQEHNLIPFLTALENVTLPLQLAKAADSAARAQELLAQVGLAARMHHRLEALSGGEQQRVGIACALANRPALLLADEPTGELDNDTAHTIMSLFTALSRSEGVAMLMVTHDLEMASYAQRVVVMRDGAVVDSTQQKEEPQERTHD